MCRDDKDLGGIGASQPSAERATRASPQAPTGLGHSASIADAVQPCEFPGSSVGCRKCAPCLSIDARRVARAAPYAALPADITKDTDILGITRTWTFTISDQLSTE